MPNVDPNDRIAKLQQELQAAYAEARQLPDPITGGNFTSVPPEQPQKPASEPQGDAYAPTSWGEDGYDFRTPSGQLCRLRHLPIEEIAATGVLDRITVLPGIAQDLVEKSQGQPPKKDDDLPPAETIQALTQVVNELVPLVVLQPTIWPLPAEGEQRVVGRIYVDSVPFPDRVAILETSVGGVVKWASFRQGA